MPATASSVLPDSPGSALLPQTPAASNAGAGAPAPLYTFPTPRQRTHAYLYDLVGPRAFLSPAISAAIDQARPLKVAYPPDGFPGPGLHPAHGTVPEWGQGFAGYAKR